MHRSERVSGTSRHCGTARHLWLLCGAPCYSLISTMKDRILKRFNDEIAVLERELKVDLPKEIQRARELGDLRENAEYKAAKERQEIVNARIAMLKRRAGEIALMNLDRIPRDRAGFGSTVELRASTGENVVYQLVMPEEADVEKGLISTSSPIGRAILNKEEGDEISVTTPSGKRTFELVKLVTIHDPIRPGKRATKDEVVPGEIIAADGDIELNAGRRKATLKVVNTGDRPIQIGSHYHFFETNKALDFDREKSFGMHLDIPAGTSVRFAPGESKEVVLTEFGGTGELLGLNSLTEGNWRSEANKAEAMQRARARGFI